MSTRTFTFLLVYMLAPATASPASDWDDFTNNFASDLAPIVALFGEQATKQFLSESSSFWDSIIFGVAPLGILTAVVSVIRIYGDSSLKSFIGRSQEAHGVAEAELCSSTSEDVCEMWSNGGICRVFGRPKILEFRFRKINDNESDCFYPKFVERADKGVAMDVDSYHCGIERPMDDFRSMQPTGHATDDKMTGSGPQQEELGQAGSHPNWFEIGNSSQTNQFATYPNLAFNIGIKPVPRAVLWVFTTLGVLLQSSFFVYATIVTFYRPHLYDPSTSYAKSSFVLAIFGTASLVVGMILCARLIDQKSCERRFIRKAGTDTFHWLQPGGQRIGDQLFNKFAYSANQRYYITSWKDEADPSLSTRIVSWIAISLTILGWACQFIGLRGLHGTIALYQFASTIVMAILRSILRGRRLSWRENRLKDFGRELEGHELDWQTFVLEHPGEPDSKELNWCIAEETRCGSDKSQKGTATPPSSEDGSISASGGRLMGFFVTDRDESIASVINRAMKRVQGQETVVLNEGARLMHFRTRLAYLTSPPIQAVEQAWDTETRSMASCLQEALEQSAEYIFAHIMPRDWAKSSAITWSAACQLSKEGPRQSIHFYMYRVSGRWRIDRNQLEAILGLWIWCLTGSCNLDAFISKVIFRQKSIIVNSEDAPDMTSILNLWVTQSQDVMKGGVISEYEIETSSLSVPSRTSILQCYLGQPRNISQNQLEHAEIDSGKINLSIETRSSPLQLLAQDIFTVFISRVADVLDRLQDAACRQLESSGANMMIATSSSRPYLGLSNPHTDELARILMATGVAPRTDAFTSIIPALTSKLPVLDDVVDDLVREARSLTRSAKFEEGQRLLQALAALGPEKSKARVMGTLAELYRIASMSPDQPAQELGQAGLESLKSLDSQLYSRYKDVLEHFRNPERLSSARLSNEVLSEFTKAIDVDEDRSKNRARSLILSAQFDLRQASTDEPSTIRALVHWAIRWNCAELLDDLQFIDKELINSFDHNGETPIFWALESTDNNDALQCLLNWPGLGNVINHISNFRQTPLHCAVEANRPEAVLGLLERGASLIIKDGRSRTPIELAVKEGYKGILPLLLRFATKVPTFSSGVDDALLAALEKFDDESALALLESGAKIDVDSDKSLTSVQPKNGEDNKMVIKLLMRAGVSVDKVFRYGNYGSFIEATAHLGPLETVKWLVQDRGASADIKTTKGTYESGLVAAAMAGHLEIVQWLVSEEGAAVDFQTKHGFFGSALAAASIEGHIDIVQWLVKKGGAKVDLLVNNPYGASALASAACLGRLDLVQWLVKEGQADVNLQLHHISREGTALAAAARGGELETIQWLVKEGGACVNLEWEYDGRVLSAAAIATINERLESLQWLLEEGSRMDIQTARRIWTHCLRASSWGDIIADWLLGDGAAMVKYEIPEPTLREAHTLAEKRGYDAIMRVLQDLAPTLELEN